MAPHQDNGISGETLPPTRPISPPFQDNVSYGEDSTHCPRSSVSSSITGITSFSSGTKELDDEGQRQEKKQEQPVLEPYHYLISLPSKGVRTMTAEAFNLWLDVPQKKLDVIVEIICMLHTSSLLLDDIQDSSVLRRGRPAAHIIFGEPQAINSASYLMMDGMKQVLEELKPEAGRLYVEQLLRLHRGQGWDIEWRDNVICPSVDEYLNMIDDKTGALFDLLVRLMQIEANSGTTVDYVPLVKLLGRYFQIRDDYQNLTSKQYDEQKGFCEDLNEGKMSLPMIYTLDSSTITRRILLGKGKTETMMLETKKLVLAEMEACDALSRTKALLESVEVEIYSAIESVEVQLNSRNDLIRGIMDKLRI